jgi:sugar O-acyltransferase (sialic acid O-acetyltransferase NeuD family)
VIDVVILGAGGHGREVADILVACNEHDPRYRILGYVDENCDTHGTVLNGIPVLGDFSWFAGVDRSMLRVVTGIGSPVSRRKVVDKACSLGLRFCNAIHPAAVMTPHVLMGDDIMVAAGSVLTNQIRVGDHVNVNLGCTISHDTVIEHFCNIGPGVHVCGSVRLECGCDIGAGAVVVQGITIGCWSIVGAGAVVVEDLPPNVTAVGVPARIVKTREAGWHER